METECCKCGKTIDFFTIHKNSRDVDGDSLGIHCKPCGNFVLEDLKSFRSVGIYKNNEIYEKNGRFYPYWECRYSFDNIEDYKSRIDKISDNRENYLLTFFSKEEDNE